MSEFTVTREPLTNILESGLAALLHAHWMEVAHDKETINLNPDWDGYLEDERSHRFIGYAARRAGHLIGYSGFFVVRPRHYRNSIFAINDVIYLKPEERGVEGVRLIKETEKALRDLAITKIFYHVKTDAPLGSPAGDSLEAIEYDMEIEALTGISFDKWIMQTAGDRTLGGVLRALGYNHIENHFGKLLTGAP